MYAMSYISETCRIIMVEVDDSVIKTALESIISGQDFRQPLHKYTDSLFFNVISDFFNFLEENADIINDDDDWYENLLVENEKCSPEMRATFAGMPKKTIQNIKQYNGEMHRIARCTKHWNHQNIKQHKEVIHRIARGTEH